MRLETPKFAKAIVGRGVKLGVVSDQGPKTSLFHVQLPDGTFAKKPAQKNNKWLYFVEGDDYGPITFSAEGSSGSNS